MRATLDPRRPSPGELVTVAITVRNDGDHVATGVDLIDAVSPNATVRSAVSSALGSGDEAACRVMARRVVCPLGEIEHGDVVIVRVRLIVARDPASSRLAQRISLSSGEQDLAEQHDVSSRISDSHPSDLPKAGLPGTPITLIMFFGLVLAARRGSGRIGRR